jgi:MerR family transcriptional regulator, heat shock protein HspR
MPQTANHYYSLQVVANILGVHPQAIRLYEREGLVSSIRCGPDRFYSPSQIDRLRVIVQLRQELGINLAGIEVILHMRDRLREFSERAAGLLPSEHQASTPPAHGEAAKTVKILVRDDS